MVDRPDERVSPVDSVDVRSWHQGAFLEQIEY
jgi:hypothetical protein